VYNFSPGRFTIHSNYYVNFLVGYCLLLLLLLLLLLVVVVVFGPWVSLGSNQSPVRQPVWLWYAALWGSS